MSRGRSGLGFAVGVLVGAAAVGLVAGGVLSWTDTRQAAAPSAEHEIETVIPDVGADAADAEWEGRAEGESARASTGSARTGGVALRFGHCHVGGGINCVVDGDTFYLAGQKVRIAGIDAPETHDYRCASELRLGRRATQTLHALLNSGAVTMTSIDRDRDSYGRLLRNVAVDGQDVGQAMIAAGVAREYQRGRRGWC